MSDGNLQIREFADNLLGFSHLHIAVGEAEGENGAALFHQRIHTHHLWSVEHHASAVYQQTMSGNGDAPEAVVEQLLSLGIKARVEIVAHAAHEEAVGITLCHVGEVVVLNPVYKLLHHNSSADLSVVHVGNEALGVVLAVVHKRRHHLHFLTKKQRTSAVGGADHQPVPGGVLAKPQVTM